MKSRYDGPDDFEAEITIFTEQEGGRRTPVGNYIRWDFMYAEDRVEDGLYMIYPEFIDEAGSPITDLLALGGTYRARTYIALDEWRQQVHRQRIKQGTAFYAMEGPRKVARGTVTKVTGLHRQVDGLS